MSSDINGYNPSHKKVSQDYKTLSNLVDSIPALVASIDCNMKLKFCNKPFKNCFSIGDNVAGKPFQLVVGKQIFDQLQRHMGKVLVGDQANFQMTIIEEKGFQYMDATLSPDFNDHQDVVGFIFHSSDVTEKNKTERALKDYFENASIGLHWVNADGIIIWANLAELNMLGYEEHEYIGHHISKFHVNMSVIEDILKCLSNKQTLRNYEAELVCKDGSIRNVAINSTVLWEGDKFIHTRCFTTDITAQKLAIKAVKESEERFKMMANLIPLVIWTTDENGSCNFLSVKWKELTGKNVEEGLGSQWLNLIHPDDRDNIKHSWTRSLSAKKPFEAKFRYVNSMGGFNINYVNSSPIYNVSGEFVGYIGILQDISSQEQIKSSLEKIVLERTEDLRRRHTDLKSAEKALKEKNEELERINNQLSTFAHSASHDLQEPLRKIQMFASRLLDLEGDKFTEKGKDFYSRIETSSQRMRALIKDLLAYSRSNSAESKFELIDLNLIFNEVVSELEIQIEEKNARIENFGLPELNIVKFQFHQLFLNLLSNALKFSRAGTDPHIVITSELIKGIQVPYTLAESDKNYYHIRISDNGIGFEPEFSEKIFEIFRRLHGKAAYEGTGIGLAICKKIVENHKGMIVAEGQINEGANFHIYLPA